MELHRGLNHPVCTRHHPDAPLSLVYMDPQTELQLHQHDYVELVCVTGGNGIHMLADNAWPVQRGDVFVIPPYCAHGYDACEDLQLINCCVQAAWCERSALRSLSGFNAFIALEPLLRSQHDFSSHLHLDEDDLNRMLKHIQEIDREMVSQENGFIASIQHHLDILFIELARKHSSGSSASHEALLQLESVLRFIDQELSSDLKLADLCRIAAMSPSTLTRYFQKCFNCSPIHYLLQRRLSRAQQLLKQNDDSISSIAKRVGFKDANYFSRMCKKYLHATPKEIRL